MDNSSEVSKVNSSFSSTASFSSAEKSYSRKRTKKLLIITIIIIVAIAVISIFLIALFSNSTNKDQVIKEPETFSEAENSALETSRNKNTEDAIQYIDSLKNQTETDKTILKISIYYDSEQYAEADSLIQTINEDELVQNQKEKLYIMASFIYAALDNAEKNNYYTQKFAEIDPGVQQ